MIIFYPTLEQLNFNSYRLVQIPTQSRDRFSFHNILNEESSSLKLRIMNNFTYAECDIIIVSVNVFWISASDALTTISIMKRLTECYLNTNGDHFHHVSWYQNNRNRPLENILQIFSLLLWIKIQFQHFERDTLYFSLKIHSTTMISNANIYIYI